jgi:hypothetical protein
MCAILVASQFGLQTPSITERTLMNVPIITRSDQQDLTRTPDTLPVVLSLHLQTTRLQLGSWVEASLAFLLAINTNSNHRLLTLRSLR